MNIRIQFFWICHVTWCSHANVSCSNCAYFMLQCPWVFQSLLLPMAYVYPGHVLGWGEMPVIAASDLLLVGTLQGSIFICPLFLPSLFSWLIVDEYQLWESKGRNILSSQRVVNVTSLLSILNLRINLFNCSFVYSPTHLFMYLGDGSHVDVRGQLAGAFSLLLPCSFWAQVKGCQAWWQRFLSAEMPLCPFVHICKILFYF